MLARVSSSLGDLRTVHAAHRRKLHEQAKALDGTACLVGFFLRDLGAFLASFRKTDGDRLLPTLNLTAFAALTGAKCAAFFPTHRARHSFARGFAILAASGTSPRTRTLRSCHVIPPAL